MPAMARLLGQCAIEVAVPPIDTTGAAQTGDWYSLKNWDHITFIIQQGAWAGGTPAVTLKQATDVSGTSSKALAETEYASQTGLTGTGYARTAITSNTFNLTTTANTTTILEIDANTLDIANGFDCIAINIASPGVNADLLCVIVILSRGRYEQSWITVPDPKVN